jgi:actin-like ATPase involved in cell morphogenesis
MMAWLKRTSVEMSIGAVIGFIIWCLIGKGMTSMLFGSLGGTVTCKTDVEIGLDKFVSMQLYSAIAGALVVFVGATFVRLRLSKRKARPAAPVDPAPGVS